MHETESFHCPFVRDRRRLVHQTSQLISPGDFLVCARDRNLPLPIRPGQKASRPPNQPASSSPQVVNTTLNTTPSASVVAPIDSAGSISPRTHKRLAAPSTPNPLIPRRYHEHARIPPNRQPALPDSTRQRRARRYAAEPTLRQPRKGERTHRRAARRQQQHHHQAPIPRAAAAAATTASLISTGAQPLQHTLLCIG